MKKNIKAIAAAIAMIITSVTNINAAESISYFVEETTPATCYTIDINMHALSRYLKLDAQQTEVLTYACDNLVAAVANLANESADNRPAAMRKAFDRNVKLAGNVLDQKQYRNYLTALNGMLNNTGLNALLYTGGDCFCGLRED